MPIAQDCKITVVIPSCRGVNLTYLSPLIEAGACFIVVDDSEGSITIDHPQFSVYNWQDRRKMLGNLDIGIPRRNGACRDFGFYLAWHQCCDHDVIIALDDDCAIGPGFVESVKLALSNRDRPIAAGCGGHFNLMELYQDIDRSRLYPRGFPYSARSGYHPWDFAGHSDGAVQFNLGLWQGVFDVAAVDKLSLVPWSFPRAALAVESVVIPPRVLVSACSMNMQFRRSLIPAAYQLPMHVEVAPGWVVDRYGDIWGGFILKTLMDLRGDLMSVGAPMVRHLKDEANLCRNIWQEHIGHLLNDEFIDLVDAAASEVKPASYLDMIGQLLEEFGVLTPRCSPLLRAYLGHLQPAMGAWIKALESVGSST